MRASDGIQQMFPDLITLCLQTQNYLCSFGGACIYFIFSVIYALNFSLNQPLDVLSGPVVGSYELLIFL